MAIDYYKGTTVLTVGDSLLMMDTKTPPHLHYKSTVSRIQTRKQEIEKKMRKTMA
jgi:hypothetical protein